VTDKARAALPATSYAILGLLSYGDAMSGYDVRKMAERSIAWFYWSPSPSQIYAELRRLRDVGLVDETTLDHAERRSKRLYSLTPAGRDALRRWIAGGQEPAVLKHSTMLKLWSGRFADGETLDGLLDEYEGWCTERLAHLRRMRERAADEEVWAFPGVVARWGVRHYESELENIAQVRKDLAALVKDRTNGNA
jgi:DNA-binding PadR family transcriptional regulator